MSVYMNVCETKEQFKLNSKYKDSRCLDCRFYRHESHSLANRCASFFSFHDTFSKKAAIAKEDYLLFFPLFLSGSEGFDSMLKINVVSFYQWHAKTVAGEE